MKDTNPALFSNYLTLVGFATVLTRNHTGPLLALPSFLTENYKETIDYMISLDSTLVAKIAKYEEALRTGVPIIPKPSTNAKEGVSELFDSTPELASIGTPQQYSAYLDTIFPGSTVKDIVYHGVVGGKASYDNILKNGFDFKSQRNWDNENSKFKEDDNTGMFFSNYATAILYGEDVEYKLNDKGEYKKVNYKNIVPAILNIKYLDSSQETASDTAAAFYKQNKSKEAIGMLGPEGGSEGVSLNYVVFEPEQIHILGNKQDIAGFKKFVATSTMPTRMSTTMYSKVALDDIKNHYLRLEVNLKLAQDLLNDPEYNKLGTYGGKIAYVGNKMWQAEIQKIQDRPSITLMGNRIYHTSTKYVEPHQILKYAETTALRINSKYLINGGKKIAWARFDESGVYVEFDPRYNYATEIIDFVESIEEEEMRAEVELLVLQEALDAEQHALMEKLIQSNELLIDGEVLPLSNIMFQKSMELANVLKRGNVSKFGQIFDKLVAKFPGVTWTWDTTIDGAARVDLATGQILVNPYLVREDTPWHEFSHFIVRGLKISNPEAFSKLVEEVEKLHEENPTGSSYSYVEANYPELKGTEEFYEEVIATEIGSQATDYTPKTGLYNTIVEFFTNILTDLGFVSPKFDTLNDIVVALYNPNFEFQFYPTNSEVSAYMFSRVMPEQVDAFTQHLMTDPSNPDDFSPAIRQIQLISDAITDQEFASDIN
jgi:hypothetical protein